MKKDRWFPSGEDCPKCNNETEVAVTDQYQDAERCPHCRWVVRFDNLDEPIKAVRY